MKAGNNFSGVNAYTGQTMGFDCRTKNGVYTPNPIGLSNCVAYWDYAHPECYAGTGTSIKDLSPTGIEGLLNGGLDTTYNQLGYFDSDGVNDSITSVSNYTISYLDNGIAMAGWFRWDGTNATMGVANFYFNNGGSPVDRFGVRMFNYNGSWYMGGMTPTVGFTNPTITANVWHFYFCQIDYLGSATWRKQAWIGKNTLVKLHDTNSHSSVEPSTTSQSVPLDRGSQGGSFYGDIGETMFFYNKYFTDAEVTRLYDTTKARYGY